MRIDRLNHLITVLEGVKAAKRKFDMHAWLTHETVEKPKDEYCGTVACAMGYAALDPTFIEQGLSLTVKIEMNDSWKHKNVKGIKEFNKLAHAKGAEVRDTVICFEGLEDAEAINAFYEFDHTHTNNCDWYDTTAYYLFSPEAYVKEIKGTKGIKTVIDRIKKVIKTDEMCVYKHFGLDAPEHIVKKKKAKTTLRLLLSQLDIADKFAKDSKANVPTEWQIQNSLLRDYAMTALKDLG
jgi:hypothetical protein